MDRNEYGDTAIASASVKRRLEPQRVILILTKSGSVSDRLIDALERELPWVRVEQVSDVRSACADFSHPVALILVDLALMREVESVSDGLMRMHPHALTAVIQPNDKTLTPALADVAASPIVRSVLPMDLRLDIWLSIIRLMLCGGEYFPPETIIQTKATTAGALVVAPQIGAVNLSESERSMIDLTVREKQILEMVARGLQNKLVAVEFGLSEHTVKVHLHNIIRKLGVHNRTEAAAKFRNFTAAFRPE